MFHTYELDKCKEIIKEWEERTGLEMEQDDVKEVCKVKGKIYC